MRYIRAKDCYISVKIDYIGVKVDYINVKVGYIRVKIGCSGVCRGYSGGRGVCGGKIFVDVGAGDGIIAGVKSPRLMVL